MKMQNVVNEKLIPLRIVKIKLKENIITNKYMLDLFNSSSNIPIFNFGDDEFILALDSFPVYITIPITP